MLYKLNDETLEDLWVALETTEETQIYWSALADGRVEGGNIFTPISEYIDSYVPIEERVLGMLEGVGDEVEFYLYKTVDEYYLAVFVDNIFFKIVLQELGEVFDRFYSVRIELIPMIELGKIFDIDFDITSFKWELVSKIVRGSL